MLSMYYHELLEHINCLAVVDTHEHIEREDARLARKADLFNTYLRHYASCDLISAGMAEEDMEFLRSESEDLARKWQVFAPWWERTRNTAYCKSLVYATEGVYGIPDINEDTYQDIDRALKAENKKGFYQKVLKDICNIETSIIDCDVGCDRQLFVSTLNIDWLLRIKSRDAILQAEKQHDLTINTLNDWANFIRKTVQDGKAKHGVVCLKSSMAYQRSIRYDRTDYADAERVFNKLLSTSDYYGWYAFGPAECPTKPLDDYLMHTLVQAAIEVGLPLQYHTGLQEGNGNDITHANPVNLLNLFLEYPKARFDVFHAGYPYGGELCAMAKNFKNVHVDLCWAHIISREYTVRFLEELLDTVPMNKVFGFGGDYCFVEGVVGHLRMARENIALALSNKVEKGYFSMGEAREVAKRLLYTNAKEFFGV